MGRKSEKLTPRQRQSQRIRREKAARIRRRDLLHKAQIAGGVLAVLLGLAGGVWAWQTHFIERTVKAVVDSGYQLTADAGFALRSLYLEGRNRTSMTDIDKALGVTKGDPILRLSLDEMRQKLEAIPSVQAAAVERSLPGTLYVRVVEREPVALWQYQGKMTLVDDKGVVMNDIDIAPYKHLPLIVGNDAPQHVSEVLAILLSEPALTKRFAAAIRVGERRWNIRLDNGMEVRLPEQHPEAAWKALAEIDARQQLLKRDVQVIDLRAPGKLFIKLSPGDAPDKAVSAKET